LFSNGSKVFSAGYVENDSSGAGICVERVTIARAISDGEKEFEAQVVVEDSPVQVAQGGPGQEDRRRSAPRRRRSGWDATQRAPIAG